MPTIITVEQAPGKIYNFEVLGYSSLSPDAAVTVVWATVRAGESLLLRDHEGLEAAMVLPERCVWAVAQQTA